MSSFLYFPGTHPSPSTTVWYAVNMSAFTSSCFTILTPHLCSLLLANQELLMSQTPQCEISVCFRPLLIEHTVHIKLKYACLSLSERRPDPEQGCVAVILGQVSMICTLSEVSQTSSFIIITLAFSYSHSTFSMNSCIG